jgi:hypothetical protein
MRYTVYNYNNLSIGEADNFGQAKDLHKENLPSDLLPYYAGLDCSGNKLKDGMADCCFDCDMPDDIAKKYNLTYEG